MSHMQEEEGISIFKSPLVHSHHSVASSSVEAPLEREETQGTHLAFNDDHRLHESPEFHRHSEATNAELFYDLFFVANLTVFTSVHDVNDKQTLAQYVGFFCIMWFTWYQVGLYDVRFSMDSVFERCAKACQFGVMMGFAISGPKFDVGKTADEESGEGPSFAAFQSLTLILMASRLILVCQYLQSLYFTRDYKRTRLPMILIASTYFVAAIIYLGLFWSFSSTTNGPGDSYIAWYVVAILETIFVTAVSSIWRAISFKGTHLVQRMSLLTLIILGEGVIGLAERCSSIVESDIFDISDPSTIGNIVCGVLILYFLYMLYFDWIEEEHFGTIRQQIWAFLHFPLHLFLVLAVEAVSQCMSWRAATVAFNNLNNQVSDLIDGLVTANGSLSTDPSSWFDVAATLNDTSVDIIHSGVQNSKNFDQTSYILLTVSDNVNAAVQAITNGTANSTNAINALELYVGSLVTVFYQVAGFEPPTTGDNDDAGALGADSASINAALNGASDQVDNDALVFELTFVYFFVSVGLVVIINALIAGLSKRSKSPLHWLRLAFSCFIGIALCLIAVIAVTNEATSTSPAFLNYILSPWLLPTVVLALFLDVLVNSTQPRSVLGRLHRHGMRQSTSQGNEQKSQVE